MPPQATEQLVEFLHTFYKVFPEYETVDVRGCFYLGASLNCSFQTYLGGESYAGQFIPYFGIVAPSLFMLSDTDPFKQRTVFSHQTSKCLCGDLQSAMDG